MFLRDKKGGGRWDEHTPCIAEGVGNGRFGQRPLGGSGRSAVVVVTARARTAVTGRDLKGCRGKRMTVMVMMMVMVMRRRTRRTRRRRVMLMIVMMMRTAKMTEDSLCMALVWWRRWVRSAGR
jgi:hypothetical protein